MIQQLVLNKLQKQQAIHPHPMIACIDFDGTIYTAGKTMWQAPYYNRKTSKLLEQFSIPFILVTGRGVWTKPAEAELRVFGMRKADIIVTGAGSMIYYRQKSGKLIPDEKRFTMLKKSTVTWKDEKGSMQKDIWDKQHILQIILRYPFSRYLRVSSDYDNEFTIRFQTRNLSIEILESIKSEILTLLPDGVKVLFAEKLFQVNTLHTFSGDVLIVPGLAGKDNAVGYILKEYAQALNQPVQGILFGDSSVDIRMLTMANDPKFYTLAQYGVHLTPRAYRILEKVTDKNPHLHISHKDGAEIIYSVFKQLLHSSYYSPSQNSTLRGIIRPFEGLVNRTVYPKLSANELSFKGLTMMIEGIDTIYLHPSQKIKGFQYYALGTGMDLFDGIRARQSITAETDGQLIDVFCDRVKEFYQLYKRAQIRFDQQKNNKAYTTLLTAISCILPSIARAQVELAGGFVAEKDEKGGSMFDRTKRLTQSLFYDAFGNGDKSYGIDKDIYDKNLATYQNRLRNIAVIPQKKQPMTQEQQKAKTRLALLQSIITEEHALVTNTLQPYPDLAETYKKTFLRVIKPYLGEQKTSLPSNLHIDNFIKIPYM